MGRHKGAVVNDVTIPDWVMICDRCWREYVGPRPSQRDFPLTEFSRTGWFIGRTKDACPKCVVMLGGYARAAKVFDEPSHEMAELSGGLGLLHSPELWGIPALCWEPFGPTGRARCTEPAGHPPIAPGIWEHAEDIVGGVRP